jgi:hypothetical protein
MHLKVFVKLKKPLKTLSSGQKKPKKPPKNPKKPKKTKKKKKKTRKNPLGWFFLKTRVFSNPVPIRIKTSETNTKYYQLHR